MTKRIGCLHTPDCICGGSGFLDDPDQRVVLVPDQLPCEGPTEAQYQRDRWRDAAQQTRAETGKALVAGLLVAFPTGDAFLQEHKNGGALARFVAGLIDHIRLLERKG